MDKGVEDESGLEGMDLGDEAVVSDEVGAELKGDSGIERGLVGKIEGKGASKEEVEADEETEVGVVARRREGEEGGVWKVTLGARC